MNGVTQSAVSQSVSSLERQFKSRFFERRNKKTSLTYEGEVFYVYSKRILKTYDAFQSKLHETQCVLAANIHIASISTIGLYDLQAYIKRFLDDYPDVNVQVEYRHTSQVYEDLLLNAVDLGLVAFPEHDAKLEVVVFRNDPLVLACHPQHPLAKLKLVKLKALRGLKMLGFKPDIPTFKAVDKMLNDQRVNVDYVKQFDNLEMVKQAAELGLGFAILPQDTIRSEVANRTLAAVPLECKLSWPLAVMYRKRKVLTPAMQRFIELLGKPL